MNLRQLAGIEAAKFVKDGIIAGPGTGSTTYYTVEEVDRHIHEEGLCTTGVTTLNTTKEQAEKLGIPLKSIDEVPAVGLMIDGADEVSADFQGVKDGGAALFFGKIVATYSKEMIWIADSSKLVDKLGKFPPPVEVTPYGPQQLPRAPEEKRFQPVLRTDENGEVLTTDGGHYTVDLYLEAIEQPESLATYSDELAGVIEHGLFLNMVSKVVVGSEKGAEILDVICCK